MDQRPPGLDERVPVRVQVLIQKITRWLIEHPEVLVAADKARVVINISGTTVRIHVEHIYERL